LAKFLLDTDTLLFSLRGDNTVLGKWRTLRADQWVISAVSGYEIQKGIEANPSTSSSKRAALLIDQVELEPVTREAAILAARVHQGLKTKGITIGVADELLAGQALALNATLVTNNIKHFENIPGLKLENWL
jgi:tRNA(fMet)-specific endonuclease VapC